MPTLDGRNLLATDGPDNQRLIGPLLQRWGANVTFAHRGETAVELARLPFTTGKDSHLMCPIENRSRREAHRHAEEPVADGLPQFAGLVEPAPLLERLRIDADSWQATLRRFFSGEKLVGNFFGPVSRLQEAAATTGRQ